MPRDQGCIREQKGRLQGPAICLPAVKDIGDQKRYFPFCSTETICYPATVQCRGNPSQTGAWLLEFPGNTPQTIPPTHEQHTASQPAFFVFFPFIVLERGGENIACNFKTSSRVCLQSCQNFIIIVTIILTILVVERH